MPRNTFTPDNDTPDTIVVTRVRNGFVLNTQPNFARGEAFAITDLYVFPTLDDVRGFLVDHDFEITDE